MLSVVPMKYVPRQVASLVPESILLQVAREEPDDLNGCFQIRLSHGQALALPVAVTGSIVEGCFPALMRAVVYSTAERESAESLGSLML